MAKPVKDALEETLEKQEFKPVGSGLPKPEDIIAFEEKQKAEPLPEEEGEELSPGGVAPIKKEDKPEIDNLTDEQRAEVEKLDNLQKKIDAKEELNDEETALLLKIKNEKPVPSEVEKTYNIAGQEYSFEELKSKAVEELELQDAVISETAMKKVVEDYYKSQNRTAATRAINNGQKENAQERERLRAERAEIIASQKMIVQTIHGLANDIARLETAAKDPVTKEEAEEGDLDTKNRYFKKLDAQDKLKDLRERKESLESEGTKNESAKMHNEVTDFLLAQPQYQTKEPILTVIQKIKNGETVDPEDKLKVRELRSLLNEATTEGESLIDTYDYWKQSGKLVIKTPIHKKSVVTLPEQNKTTITEQIRRAKERMTLALPNSDGSGGGGQRGTGKQERLSSRIIREDHAILDHGEDNFARDVLGFGIKKK
jgi:hypothetical protein